MNHNLFQELTESVTQAGAIARGERAPARTLEDPTTDTVGEGVPLPRKVVLAEKLGKFAMHFDPKIVGELNGQHVKLVKLQGEFVWHCHEHEDEMFLVLKGKLDMQFRDRTERVGEGEFIIVPRGVEHCPKAEHEVALMLFEPVGTVNTGTAGGEKTVAEPEWI